MDQESKTDFSVDRATAIGQNKNSKGVTGVSKTVSHFKPKPVKHPSWRVYKVLNDLGVPLADFGLKPIEIYYPADYYDDLMSELLNVLQDDEYEDCPYPIKDCLPIFMNIHDRQLIEGLLLLGKSVNEISDTINCDPDLVLTYKSLFFDTTVFKSNVDKLAYVRRATVGEDNIAKSEALQRGAEYFKQKYLTGSSTMSIKDVLQDTFAKAYLRLIALSDEIEYQEEAQAWGMLLVKLADQMNKQGTNKLSLSDLVINLQTDSAPVLGIADLKNGEED
jgi:hypothetical protein